MNFKDYRESRYLTRREVAQLLNRSVAMIKWLEIVETRNTPALTARYIRACEEQLELGPHPFIETRKFDPAHDPWRPLSKRAEDRKTYVGAKILSLGYPRAALQSQTRHDLRMKLRINQHLRLLVLWARGHHGWEVIDVKVPVWPNPLPRIIR